MATATGLKSIAQGRSDVLKVDPRILTIEEGWNLRDETPELKEHIETLGRSIAEVGVRKPLTVIWKDGKVVVRDGHCRLRGTMYAIEVLKAPIETVPVQAEDRYADEADQLFGQVLYNSGKPLSPFEKAKVYKKLIDWGWNQQKIAAKEGISAGRVSQILDLLAMPKEVKDMVQAGQVSATTAAQVVKTAGADATTVLTNAVATAQAEGKTKATAQHIEPANPAPVTWQAPSNPAPASWSDVPKARTMPLEQAVKEVLEASQIDNSENDFVTIRMSYEKFEVLKELFKL